MIDETQKPDASAQLTEAPRKLARSETHDLSMIIKDRVKVLKAHADEQEAACMADFESKLAAEFKWDQDEIWNQVTEAAIAAVRDAQEKIEKRCEQLGIPKSFAPSIDIAWRKRGENIAAERRAELRRVAKSSVEAMHKAAITKIERQSLDLRTQVVAMGLVSSEARLFLESLAPITEAMKPLEFHQMQKKLDDEAAQRAALHPRRNMLGYDGA